MMRLSCLAVIGLCVGVTLAQAKKPAKTESGTPAGEKPAAKAHEAGPKQASNQIPMHRKPRGRRRPVTTRQVLNSRVLQVAFVESDLESVLEWVSRYTGTTVLIRWNALEAAGISRDTPISLKARNLRMSQILWLIMNEIDAGEKLAYRASGSLLVFSTHADLNREVVTKVYDVRDLLVRVPYWANMQSGRVVDGVTSRGFGRTEITQFRSGVRMWTDDDEGERWDNAWDPGRSEEMQELIDAIVATIEPDSWSVNGGPGFVTSFRDGLLIVRNTVDVHQKIGGPLREEDISGRR